MIDIRHVAITLALIAAAAAAQESADDAIAPAEAETAQSEHAAATPNLLINGGFDEVNGRTPASWDLYVLPGSGAEGGTETAARSGRFAASIEMPEPNPADPVTNWSQNILADVAGKTLEVSGYIRTENASEAAIWLQCWARNPLRVVHGATTFDTAPVYGTQDWQHVAMIVKVPENSDFVTCRCVLRGRGMAWFDDVLVTIRSATVATGKPRDRATPRNETTSASSQPPAAIAAPEQPAAAIGNERPENPQLGLDHERAQSAAIAANAAMNRALGSILAEPEAERDTIDFGASPSYLLPPWPQGSGTNQTMYEWLYGPTLVPPTPVPVEQERRR